MNLAHSATDRRELVVDVCLGTLTGLLLSLLGIRDITNIESPSTWAVIGAVFGLVAGVLEWRTLLLVLDVGFTIVVVVIAESPVISGIAPLWVRNDPLPSHLDAVVALSEMVHTDTTLSADAFDRLRDGVAIARRDTTTWIVTSRVNMRSDNEMVYSDRDQRELIAEAGLENRWRVVDSVASTHDEAVRSAALLLPGRRNIAVVTSPMHTRRACSTFERLGFQVTCRAARTHHRVTWHPKAARDRLAAFRDFVYELLGMAEYRARGWLSSR